MRDVAGLAETTRRQRGLIVGRFLAQTFGADDIDVTKIDTVAMSRFVLGEGRDWGAGGGARRWQFDRLLSEVPPDVR